MPEERSKRGRIALCAERTRERRVPGEETAGVLECERQLSCDRKSFARVPDRGGQQFRKRPAAPALVKYLPRIDEAGDGDSGAAVARDAVGVSLKGRRRGRFAAGADGGDAAFAGRICEDERVAAEVIAMRLHHRQHR